VPPSLKYRNPAFYYGFHVIFTLISDYFFKEHLVFVVETVGDYREIKTITFMYKIMLLIYFNVSFPSYFYFVLALTKFCKAEISASPK
jgi:hypothetical protein